MSFSSVNQFSNATGSSNSGCEFWNPVSMEACEPSFEIPQTNDDQSSFFEDSFTSKTPEIVYCQTNNPTTQVSSFDPIPSWCEHERDRVDLSIDPLLENMGTSLIPYEKYAPEKLEEIPDLREAKKSKGFRNVNMPPLRLQESDEDQPPLQWTQCLQNGVSLINHSLSADFTSPKNSA